MPSQGFIPIILTLALGRHRRSPLVRGGFFLFQRHPPSGSHGGWGTSDGGGVVSGGIPSYNSGVMTETILHHTSSLDGTNELDGYRVRWNGQHEEMQHPRKIECSWATVAVEPLPDMTVVFAAQELSQLIFRYIADFQKSEQQVFTTSVSGVNRRSFQRGILAL